MSSFYNGRLSNPLSSQTAFSSCWRSDQGFPAHQPKLIGFSTVQLLRDNASRDASNSKRTGGRAAQRSSARKRKQEVIAAKQAQRICRRDRRLQRPLWCGTDALNEVLSVCLKRLISTNDNESTTVLRCQPRSLP